MSDSKEKEQKKTVYHFSPVKQAEYLKLVAGFSALLGYDEYKSFKAIHNFRFSSIKLGSLYFIAQLKDFEAIKNSLDNRGKIKLLSTLQNLSDVFYRIKDMEPTPDFNLYTIDKNDVKECIEEGLCNYLYIIQNLEADIYNYFFENDVIFLTDKQILELNNIFKNEKTQYPLLDIISNALTLEIKN